MPRQRMLPPILNYGGGGRDEVVIGPRLYDSGSPKKGIGVAALGRILFHRFWILIILSEQGVQSFLIEHFFMTFFVHS